MNRQDSSVSNPRPITSQDIPLKAEVTRRMAQYCRAVYETTRAFAKARREWTELRRIMAEALRRPELDKGILEERLRIVKELHEAAMERRRETEDIRVEAEAIMKILSKANQR